MPGSRIIKEGVEEASRKTTLFYFSSSFLPWVWPALSFLSSPLCGRNLLMVEIALVAGSKKEKKERKEASFLASLGAWWWWPNLFILGEVLMAETCKEEEGAWWFSSRKIVAHTTSEVRRGIR